MQCFDEVPKNSAARNEKIYRRAFSSNLQWLLCSVIGMTRWWMHIVFLVFFFLFSSFLKNHLVSPSFPTETKMWDDIGTATELRALRTWMQDFSTFPRSSPILIGFLPWSMDILTLQCRLPESAMRLDVFGCFTHSLRFLIPFLNIRFKSNLGVGLALTEEKTDFSEVRKSSLGCRKDFPLSTFN